MPIYNKVVLRKAITFGNVTVLLFKAIKKNK